jgi:hypothetical protein
MLDPGNFSAKNMPEMYRGGLGAATGVSLAGGFVTRWFGAFLQTAWGSGSMQRATFTTNFALPPKADVTAYASTLRASFRVPFNLVALNVGPEVGLLEVDVKEVLTGQPVITGGLWGGLDIQPLCDWGARVVGDVAAYGPQSNVVADRGPVATLQIGAFFEPNARCRRERSTQFGLRAGGR